MKQKSSKYLHISLLAIFIFVIIPLVINYTLLLPHQFQVVGTDSDWLQFWPTYLSAFASFLMIAYTARTLRVTEAQLEELKKERKEDVEERKDAVRPHLMFDIIVYQNAFYLRIRNIGQFDAYNVSVKIGDDFINEIQDKHRDIFRLMQHPFYVPSNSSKYFFIGWCEDINAEWKDKNVVLNATGSYCDKYPINVQIDLNLFVNKMHFVVDDELTTAVKYIKQGLITQNDQYYTIQKSLDVIAKNLDKVSKNKEFEQL